MRSITISKTDTQAPASRSSRVLNIALWILQGSLAVLFLWHGWLFIAPPAEMVAMIDASIAPGLRSVQGCAHAVTDGDVMMADQCHPLTS